MMDNLGLDGRNERKRSRSEINNPIRKMEILKGLKDDQDESLVEIETKVISGLIDNIDEKNVRTLIECFNPVIRNSPDYIKEQMLDCSREWENRKDTFIGTINYIVHGSQNSMEKEEQMQVMGIERLSETLIREIENRMPKYCRKCEEWYTVKLVDTPEMHCMWCKVGMHDCTEMNELSKYPGIKWLCEKCDPPFINHYLPKIDHEAFFDGFKMEKTKNKNINEDKKKENEEQEKKQGNSEEDDEVVEIVKDIGVEQEKEGSEENKNKDKKTEAKQIEKKECWFWINRKCKFGDKCKDNHPTQCITMMKSGRCPDSRCKLAHPKICRNLYNEGYCSRRNCWYIHPTNIKNQYVFGDNKQGTNTNKRSPNNIAPNKQWNQYSNNKQWNQNNNNNNINNHWNQSDNSNIRCNNTNYDPFLVQWPTPWEANRPMKMMIGKILEEITTKMMYM